eukprot:TRINITY_DN19642_c0_g1_i1.p1 TRINITY_DN19642_c0_g1~~TRINITY_DN19642_c0_g1_i1.p1  ORF type:complete len:560 (-),score=111.03 TRINITY_DN19642_c0_g1_i1:240-1877(-)
MVSRHSREIAFARVAQSAHIHPDVLSMETSEDAPVLFVDEDAKCGTGVNGRCGSGQSGYCSAGTSFDILLNQLQAAHQAELHHVQRQLDAFQRPLVIQQKQEEQQKQEAGRTSESSSDSRRETLGSGAEEKLEDANSVPQAAKTTKGLKHIRHEETKFEDSNMLQRIVHHHSFDVFFAVVILLNSFVMAFEAQYHGYTIGQALSYAHHVKMVDDYYPYADVIIEVFSWVFGLLFTIEICMKIAALRLSTFRDPWSWLDSIIVLLWIVSKLGEGILPVNSTILRVTRLARLLRLFKLAKKIQGFDSLFTMTVAMQNCASVLFWTFVMLGLVQLMIALFLSQFLHSFYFLTTMDTNQVLVFEYFGTFARAFFTMFEITLGNWPPACRVLAENVNEIFFFLGLMHKLAIGFAVVAVINGVFIQETFSVSALDDVVMVRRKEKMARFHLRKMMDLWKEADNSDDGKISKQEWCELLEDKSIKTWLSSMELETRDAELVFRLIDESDDGEVSFAELVAGVARLKGSARSLDLLALRRAQDDLVKRLFPPA